jgi:hypothetical protein
MKKLILSLTAAAIVAAPLATAVTATAAPASSVSATAAASSSTVQYTGQGVSNGVLNNDLGGDTGYLLWVFNAKGATSPTITLPDGSTAPMEASGNGFKFESKFFPVSDLSKASVSYQGTAKNPVLTISHGHGVDSNVPDTTVYDAVEGGTVAGDSDDVFGYHKQHTDTRTWVSDKGTEYTEVTHYGYDFDVEQVAIIGDYTGNVVGWKLGATSNPVTNTIGYTGTERGTVADGETFKSFTYNGSETSFPMAVPGGIRSGLTVNDHWVNGGDDVVRQFDRMKA